MAVTQSSSLALPFNGAHPEHRFGWIPYQLGGGGEGGLAATEQETAMWRRPIEKKWFNEEISEIYCRRSSSFTIIIGLFKQNRFEVVKFMASASSSAAAAVTRVTSVGCCVLLICRVERRTGGRDGGGSVQLQCQRMITPPHTRDRNQSEMCNMSALNPQPSDSGQPPESVFYSFFTIVKESLME